MGHNKEISIKRPLDINNQNLELPKAKAVKNNFSDTIKKGENSVHSNSEKVLTGTILLREIENYKAAWKQGKEGEYIANYLSEKNFLKGNTETSEEFYSLLLIESIEKGDRETVQHVLALPHADNILVKKSNSSHSPVSVLLGSNNNEIFADIVEYLKTNSQSIERANLAANDYHYSYIESCLQYPRFSDKEVLELSYPLALLYDLEHNKDLMRLVENKEIFELICGKED